MRTKVGALEGPKSPMKWFGGEIKSSSSNRTWTSAEGSDRG